MITTLSFSPPLHRVVGTGTAALGTLERAFDPARRGKVHWTAMGRSALRAILLHLRATGRLEDSGSEVLVPRWACLAFYRTLQKVCFPTPQDSPALRGVVAYHQYGFPQRLDLIAQRCRDRGLFLIENCVNSVLDGPSPHLIGEVGIASFFSLPKMFSTVIGGALVTRDTGLDEFCRDYFREDEAWIPRLTRSVRLLHAAGMASSRVSELLHAVSDYGRRVPPVDLRLLDQDLGDGAIERRKGNYRRLLKEFADAPFFAGLEDDVIPYVAPLFGPAEFLTRLAARLAENGWESGIYHFDAARDVFAPRFVPCVPLPIHQGLGDEAMGTLIETIRDEWRRHNGHR